MTDLENKGQYLISQNNFLDFLTTAQHYGLPTRLVDFTYNPYIALFFAFYEQKKGGDSEYYYLMYCNLLDNLSFINLPIDRRKNLYSTSSFSNEIINAFSTLSIMREEKNDYELLNYLWAAIRNLNYPNEKFDITMYGDLQFIKKGFTDRKCVFWEPKNSNIRIAAQEGLFLIPDEIQSELYLNDLYKNLSILCIHKKLYWKIHNYLDSIGIREERLMPDLQSLCTLVTRLNEI